MAGTTQYFGISYPTATDYVKDGASNMQTIATGFDTAVAIPTYNNQTGTTYTFVLADAAKTVTSNNASAVTFTIPPQSSVAWATGTTLKISNLGAGAITFAGGSGVTVTNTATTVPQYGEASLVRTGSDAWTVVATVATAPGLTLITSSTFTTQSTINVNGCFSNTYQNYKIIVSINAATNSQYLRMRLRNAGTDKTGTGYSYCIIGLSSAGAAANNYGASTSNWEILGMYGGAGYADRSKVSFEVLSPYDSTARTNILGLSWGMSPGGTNFGGTINGLFYDTDSCDSFTLYVDSGTVSGSVKVYGYKNS